jgi:hypothetical protein
MPAFPPEIKNTPLFNLILTAVLIVIAVIPNILLGVIGGLFAVFLKTAPKSKGITSNEISEKLKEKRKMK